MLHTSTRLNLDLGGGLTPLLPVIASSLANELKYRAIYFAAARLAMGAI